MELDRQEGWYIKCLSKEGCCWGFRRQERKVFFRPRTNEYSRDGWSCLESPVCYYFSKINFVWTNIRAWKRGLSSKDILYVFDGELINKDDIEYKGCKVGRYSYGYEDLLELFR